MKQRHILLIILTILILIFLFFPTLKLAKDRHDHQSRERQNEIKNFRPQTTFATASPIFRIDHIFVSGHFKVRRVQVPRNHLTRLASDHLPLIADLHFKDEHCSAIGSPEEN